jgi:hypothetical protein
VRACSAASSTLMCERVARRHHHRVHLVGAERIDRDGQRQRRVDAAREAHDDAGEAVLVT